jgi:GT2 family glycosyltransferase
VRRRAVAAGEPGNNSAVAAIANPSLYPAREKRVDLLRWRRIPGGLRYLRRCGVMATVSRILPSLQTYRVWVRSYDKLVPQDAVEITEHIRHMTARPLISVLMPVATHDLSSLKQTIDGIVGQLYPKWELCMGVEPAGFAVAAKIAATYGDRRIKLAQSDSGAGFADTANAALALAEGRLVGLVQVGDELACYALYVVALEAEKHPDAVLLYSDEDAIGPRGRRFRPHFKCDWNPDLVRGCDMIGRLAVYRRTLVERVGGFRRGFAGAEEYDLVLRASEQTTADRIRHIPSILYHRRRGSERMAAARESLCRALREHLLRTRIAAAVTPLPPYSARVRYLVPEPRPGVSLIVPTRDRVDLLQRCVDGLLFATDYPNLEVLVADNNSERVDTQAYFVRLQAEPRVRVLRYPGPFNFSAINNFALGQASHDIIGLVNNDVEVIHSDWLLEMVSHVLRPEIGAVGAKLYYPNDRIQHAGIIVGLGGAAGHAFRHFKRSAPGYGGRLALTQNLSAVTAACMLLRKAVFCEVGGLDAANLAVAFNDVDLCLRIRERGYRILWTPFAELYHWESVSRGSDLAPEQVERFRRETKYLAERWAAVITHDPYYNPNLTVDRENFGLAFPPRVMRPWREHALLGRP